MFVPMLNSIFHTPMARYSAIKHQPANWVKPASPK